ncbi:MAG: L-tyrosine C(3)-methyltransferase [Bacteroidia bacterium]|nr:L-tyrosine C(3)-methyltransferase [Bacteroidia bacterium]
MKAVKNYFKYDNRSVLRSIEYAQQIAFAPFVFQASRTLRITGLLKIVEDYGPAGISMQDAAKKSGLPLYGVQVLFEAGLGIGLLIVDKDKFNITKTGSYILHDKMTIVNMDFVHDVCYLGMFELDKSIATGKPEGLKIFGKWKTVYEALSSLPAQVQKSWFAFDHYYSDTSFDAALPHVFNNKPRKILDIGGNTGKWAISCLNYSPAVKMGIVDLPGQLKMAKENIKKKGFADRVSFYELNLLDKKSRLPKGYDAIWMSQFLDCFSEKQIVSILKKCHEALDDKGQVFIMEPLWDRQNFEVSSFCLQMTSLYFTNIANGNSKMYGSKQFVSLIEKAGFSVVEEFDDIGICHTLLKSTKTIKSTTKKHSGKKLKKEMLVELNT